MMMLSLLSAFFRVVLSAVIIFILVRVTHMLSHIERVGLGLMGGSAFMTVAVALDYQQQGTPFDVWSGVILSAGNLLFLLGFVRRKLKHDENNEEQRRMAERHLRARGKL